MAKFPLDKTPLGKVLESARQREPDPETGESYSQIGVARELRRRGVQIEDRSYASIENETKLAKPAIINAIPGILPVSVLELVRAMGYAVTFEGIRTEEDAVLLEAFQSASAETQRIVRLALGLEVPRPQNSPDTQRRRLAAMARQDRQGTQE